MSGIGPEWWPQPIREAEERVSDVCTWLNTMFDVGTIEEQREALREVQKVVVESAELWKAFDAEE